MNDNQPHQCRNPPPPQQPPTQPPAEAPPPPAIDPALCPHGTEWEDADCIPDVNGFVPTIEWAVTTSMGDMISPSTSERARDWSRFDCFMDMFPTLHLLNIVCETNIQSNKRQEKLTTSEEIIKLFGVLILITRFEFGSRASLWSTVQQYKYIPTASLGRTGMSRNRFDHLFACLRFSKQLDERPEDMTSEAWRWTLVDDFVKAFNDHRERHFIPSNMICVDESISRWYGQGGHWINAGLPCYVSIDRKPENGCEIQNAACGKSGVMLQLKLVKHTEEEAAGDQEDNNGGGISSVVELMLCDSKSTGSIPALHATG